jgi:extracellular factor (EF) 3-hydroxypalmitic acid methyl ester biosynthesis protein
VLMPVLTAEQVGERLRLAFEELGPIGAFLPERVPPVRLPPPFDDHTEAAAGLAEHFPAGRGGVRRWLDARFGSPDPALAGAVADLDVLGRHKLLSALTALAHTYRWDTVPPDPERFEERRIRLPPGIAEPLAAVARALEHPRVGTTWSLHLCNWWMTDRPGGAAFVPAELSRAELRIAFPWLGPPHDADLAAFSLTFVLTEARGAPVLAAIRRAIGAAAREEVHETGYALDRLSADIEAMAEPFTRIIRDAHVDRRTWLSLVQPPFAWAAEVAPGEEAALATPGPSGMQTGVVQAVDAALGLDRTTFLGRAARDGRRFMPGPHRRFLEHLDELGPVLRAFVERSRDPHLVRLYNECVRNLRTFRVVHQKRGAAYLRIGRVRSGPRVSTGLAVPWTDDARNDAAVEVGDDPVETFEATMAERIAETSAAMIATAGAGDRPTLRDLAPGDLDRILAVATRRRVAAGHDVIRADERRQALYVIRSGTVRIAPPGEGLPAGRLGPGEVFGEVAFLLNEGAPAGVVAEEDLEVDVVDRDELHRVLAEDQALAARVFKALAMLEAERLRDTVRRAGGVRAGDLPVPHDPRLEPAGVPAPGTEAAVTALLDAGRAVPGRRGDGGQALAAACDALVAHLAGLPGDQAILAGRHVLRAAFPVLGASRLLRLAMLGPGATRRDTAALEQALTGRPAGDGAVGELVDGWALRLPVFASLRARASAVHEAIGSVRVDRPAVTCVQSLPGPEFGAFDPAVRLTVVDSDAGALERAAAVCPARPRTVHESIVHLARGLGRVPMPPQDVIYGLGAFEHLDDRDAVRVIDWAHAHLRPGGVVLVGGPATDASDAAFLRHVLGWAPRRRSPAQLAHLFNRSEFLAAPVVAWTDAPGGASYALVRRAP